MSNLLSIDAPPGIFFSGRRPTGISSKPTLYHFKSNSLKISLIDLFQKIIDYLRVLFRKPFPNMSRSASLKVAKRAYPGSLLQSGASAERKTGYLKRPNALTRVKTGRSISPTKNQLFRLYAVLTGDTSTLFCQRAWSLAAPSPSGVTSNPSSRTGWVYLH